MARIDQFTETRVMLSKTACPACATHSLELRLFCERGDSCQHMAVCTRCNLRLDVQPGRMSAELAGLLRDLACPDCGKKAAEFAMVCELLTRSCDPAVICVACGHSYGSRVASTA